MNIYSSISAPLMVFLLLLILAVSLVFVVYFFKKNKEEFTKLQRIVLATIKFISVSLIAVLILSIIIETLTQREEKPLLVVGIDNSESIQTNEDFTQNITQLNNQIKSQLSDKFNIETLLFGNSVEKDKEPDFNDQKSNYSSLFTEIDKRYFNLNVGAIVLVGDGIYNEGKNPEQYQPRIQAPVYSIGVGDTSVNMDQAIVDVTHNPNVFLNNTFPVEVEITFKEFPGKNSQLSIYMDNKLIFAENIEIPNPNYYIKKTIDVKAENIGLKNVEIHLSPFVNEKNTQNNRRRFTIEVHDNKKKILVLSQGPHPDIGALTQTLQDKANFEVHIKNPSTFAGDFSKYDLLVLNQLPSLRSQHLDVFSKIKEEDIPLMLIVGPNTSIAGLNNLHLDFKMNPTLINEESSPFFNEAFPLFSIPTNIQDVEKIYPPLITHFTEIEFSTDYQVLAYQKINQIEMNYPLIIAGEINERKTGLLLGEGLWRWRFHEYQNYSTQAAFNQIFINLFNYLSLKEEKDQFKVQYQRICSETNMVKIKAQVFNDIYESISNAEVRLTLTDSTLNELNYVFDSNESTYNLNLGFLPPGNYQFTSTATFGDNTFTKHGSFSVEEVNIEQQELHARFNTLKVISQNTAGEYFNIADSESLINKLKEDSKSTVRIHNEKNISEAIDIKWLVVLILLLLFLEWFLRKFWGSY